MPIVPSLPNSGVVKQRNVIFIPDPVVRYIEILTNIASSSPKAANGRGDNREYEVGRRGRRWERIDDHIEEETTSYKFKM
ncbi:MAG: hypothetical protein K2L34_00945, partial [Muribaculaceae bacterium]|nr:hypothetical protein [Muribaculaceae bacterium]